MRRPALASIFGAILSVAAIGGAKAIQAEDASPAARRACVELRTAADVKNKIRANLAGDFCLAKDIDLASIPNFKPIGNPSPGDFKGTLDGRNHVLKNLTINVSNGAAAMFIAVSGTIKNLGLKNVSVTATGEDVGVGGLAVALETGGRISRVYTTGAVTHVGKAGVVGGLAGIIREDSRIRFSYSKAAVKQRGNLGTAGGLVGLAIGSSTITDSYALGPVTGRATTYAGGLVGEGAGRIRYSYATGSVVVGNNGYAGGLVGIFEGDAMAVYAKGSVTGGRFSTVAGLVGNLAAPASVYQSYAVGRVKGKHGSSRGGLVALTDVSAMVDAGYWDKQATGQSNSAEGYGRTTAELKAGLPDGFQEKIWTINPTKSYPRLKPRG